MEDKQIRRWLYYLLPKYSLSRTREYGRAGVFWLPLLLFPIPFGLSRTREYGRTFSKK